LNGWWLEFLEQDHKVMRFGSRIENVSHQGLELTWEAHGRIQDVGHDDPYRWCYAHTVVAWGSGSFHGMSDPTANVRSVVDEDDRGLTRVQSWFSTTNDNEMPLRSYLPRGFDFRRVPDDDKVLHMAMNLRPADHWTDPDTRYGDQEAPPAPIDAGLGRLSWIGEAVLRDDDPGDCGPLTPDFLCTAGGYGVVHQAGIIGGRDIDVIQPPRSVVPVRPLGAFSGCVDAADPSPGRIRTQEIVVDNVPFEHAVPMLTSWSLAYWCPGDEHVRAAAAWIGSFTYERIDPALQPQASGRLRYTVHSLMTDDGGDEGVAFQHRVHVLGFGPLEPAGPIVLDPTPR
jgi:hypothetical protein